MKLEPKAKPIRIRIKLGNSEYSSWDSVKKSNFSIKELYPLFKDGRLERWLMQIGEVKLAHITDYLSKHCGNGNLQDYIRFLSLFFNEVAVSLSVSAYKGEEWSLYDYLSSTHLDTIKFIYAKTMDVEEIDWGEEFAKLVTDEETYKYLFTYIDRFSRNNLQSEMYWNLWLDIITFYDICSKKGYQFASAFKDELSLDYITYIYQNKCFQIPYIDWGKIFADCVKDWATDSERIEKIIKHDCNHTTSFYKRCAENGFEEAKKMLDPWFVLANSDEYEIIIKALNEWGLFGNYNKYYYNYNNLKLPLGKQILDFLQSLKNLRSENRSWGDDCSYDSDYYLEDEKQIMIYVDRRPKTESGYCFDNYQKEELKAMRERGVKLAGYALDNSEKSYWEISQHAVVLFREELNNKRL